MSVTATGVGSSLVALPEGVSGSTATELTAKGALAAGLAAKGTASELASGRSIVGAPVADARAADQVVIRAGSPLPVFREMATNGLRQLGALLPMVERQLVASVGALTPAPLGYLARAMGDAAHQVGTGFAAMGSAGSPSDADETGAMTQGGQAASPPGLTVTASVGESRPPTLPFIKAAGSAPEVVRAAPLADDATGLGKSPATASKPAINAAGATKSDSSVGGVSVRPGATDADFPGVVTRLAAPRQAAGPVSASTVAGQSKPPPVGGPGNDRNERGSGGVARTADPGPHGRMANDDVSGDIAEVAVGWRGAARQILQQTSDALEQISVRLQPTALSPHPAVVAPDLLWAMTQVAGAQRQVAASMAVLTGAVSRRRSTAAGPSGLSLRWGDRGQLGPLTSAVAVFGTGLLLILMALMAGLWIASATTIGLCAGFGVALLWGWRVSVGARGLRLALRR